MEVSSGTAHLPLLSSAPLHQLAHQEAKVALLGRCQKQLALLGHTAWDLLNPGAFLSVGRMSGDEAVGFWKGQQWGEGELTVRDFLPVGSC